MTEILAVLADPRTWVVAGPVLLVASLAMWCEPKDDRTWTR